MKADKLPYYWNAFNGFKIITNTNLTKRGDLVKVNRTFWERFFSRPWMPRINYKWIFGPDVPDWDVYILYHNNTLVMHPATFEELKKQTDFK